jgi:hypothetical protein
MDPRRQLLLECANVLADHWAQLPALRIQKRQQHQTSFFRDE